MEIRGEHLKKKETHDIVADCANLSLEHNGPREVTVRTLCSLSILCEHGCTVN